MCASRIAQSLDICRSHVRGKHARGRTPSAERVVDDGVRCRRQDAFRKRFRLSKQRPGPEAKREPRIGAVPYHRRRQDVENGKSVDAVRMVESHAICEATAAIVPGDAEVRKPEPLHGDHHVSCHGPFCIWRMVRGGDGTTAAPVAAKVGADDREIARKQRRDAAPHQVGLRKTVQQQDRRSGPGPAQENAGLAGFDFGSFELGHHSGTARSSAAWVRAAGGREGRLTL